MTTTDRRGAGRVEVGFPVELITARGYMEAAVRDLSRTGLRFRIKAADLGFGPTSDVSLVARSIGSLLTQPFTLNLHYRRLGPLLRKTVRLTRVGVPTDSPDAVELCCAFDEPLGDEEAVILEIPLPPYDPAAAAWCPEDAMPTDCAGSMNFFPDEDSEVRAPAAASSSARRAHRAFVAGTRPSAPASIFCRTDLVTFVGVRVRLSRDVVGRGVAAALAGPSEAAEAFVAAFGGTVTLRVIAGDEDLWQGEMRVSGVELPADHPEQMLVTLAFPRRLRPSEMRALGLVDAAA